MKKELCKSIGLIAGVFIIGTLLYAGLFRTPIYEGLNVYFYRAAILLLITAVILFAGLAAFKYGQRRVKIEWKDIIVALTITFFLNFSFLSLITVALDRSISVFILSEMADNSSRVYTKQDVEDVFLKVYMNDYKAMDRRFEEQLISGNIEEQNGGYIITEKGTRLINVFRKIAWLFPIDNRFLYPEHKEE